MQTVLLIGLIFLVYFDADILMRKDKDLYDEKMHYSPRIWSFLAFLAFVVFGPIYLLRRAKYKEAYEKKNPNIFLDPRKKTRILLSDAAGIVLTWFLAIFWFHLILKGFGEYVSFLDSELVRLLIATLFESFVMIALIYGVSKKYLKQDFWDIVGVRAKERSFFKHFIVPAFVGVGFAAVSSSIVLGRNIQPSTPLSQILESTHSSSALMLFLGVAVLLAPLFEELIFRGYFFHVMKKFRGETFAICFVSLVFSFLHVGQYWGDWVAIMVVTLLGFNLTVMRVWGGSTLSSIVMHYFYNGCVALIPILMLLVSNPAYMQYQMKSHILSFDQKEELLLESIELQPDSANSYNDLAWLYAENDQSLDEGLELIDKGLSLNLVGPQKQAFLDTKAEVLYKLGRYEEAVEIEKGLVENNSSNLMWKKQLDKFNKALNE